MTDAPFTVASFDGKLEDETFDRTSNVHKNPDSAGKTIAAFATSQGGTILVGVANDGTKEGIGIDKQEFQHRLSQIFENLDPRPTLEGPIFLEENNMVFAVVRVVSLGAAGPCFYKNSAYRREGDQNIQMSPDEIHRKWKQQRKLYFEERKTSAVRDEADTEALQILLEACKNRKDVPHTPEGMMRGYNLLDNDGKHLTTLGVLVLARNPSQCIPSSRLILVRFRGSSPVDRIASVNIAEPLHRVVASCETFFNVNLPVVERFEGLVRREETIIPARVLREALLNLLAHRDYESVQETIIRIFDDRIEFINPCAVSKEEFAKIMSTQLPVHHNPLIYNILRLLGFAEGTGTGIPLIQTQMAQLGFPDPVFDIVDKIFILTLSFREDVTKNMKKDLAGVYTLIQKKKTVTSTDVMKLLNTNRPRALKLLKELIRRNVIAHIGKRRGSKYLIYMDRTIMA